MEHRKINRESTVCRQSITGIHRDPNRVHTDSDIDSSLAWRRSSVVGLIARNSAETPRARRGIFQNKYPAKDRPLNQYCRVPNKLLHARMFPNKDAVIKRYPPHSIDGISRTYVDPNSEIIYRQVLHQFSAGKDEMQCSQPAMPCGLLAWPLDLATLSSRRRDGLTRSGIEQVLTSWINYAGERTWGWGWKFGNCHFGGNGESSTLPGYVIHTHSWSESVWIENNEYLDSESKNNRDQNFRSCQLSHPGPCTK